MTAITETPEFKEAVAKAAAVAMAALRDDLLAQMSKMRGTPAEGVGDVKFAELLSMQLAELNDQGSGRKRVAPEIMRARADAHERMTMLVLKARENRLVPSYRLKQKIYFDECLVEPMFIDPQTKRHKPTEIDWPGVPNEAMAPANEVAQEIFAAFLESIGSVPKEVAQLGDAPLRMTAGGLVVKGAPRPQRDGLRLPDESAPVGQGLRVKGRAFPADEGQSIHVLGTTAAPARTSAV